MPDFLKSDSQIEKYSEILILKLLNLVEHLSDTQDNFQRDKQQMLNSESNLHFFFFTKSCFHAVYHTKSFSTDSI